MINNKMDDFLREKLEDMPELKRHDWNKISRRVSVLNYFKFGLTHFNIYYTLLILGSLSGITSAYLGFNTNPDYLTSKNPNTKPQSTLVAASMLGTPKESFEIQVNKPDEIKSKKVIELQPIAPVSAQVEALIDPENEILAGAFAKKEINKFDLPIVPLEEISSKEHKGFQNNTNNQLAAAPENKTKIVSKRWSVEAFSQPVFSNAYAVSSTVGGDFNGIETDKQKYAYGMNVSLAINHIQFQAGLLYVFNSKNFSSNYQREEITTVKSYKKYSSVTYSLETGNEVRVRTDSVLVSSQKVENKSYRLNNLNSYKVLEMPLIVGYKTWYRRFAFAVKGGVIVDLYKNASGITSNSNALLGLDKIPFLSPNLTLTASAGAYYRINSNVSFMFEPYITRNFNSLKNNKVGILPTPTASGIRLGFAYDF